MLIPVSITLRLLLNFIVEPVTCLKFNVLQEISIELVLIVKGIEFLDLKFKEEPNWIAPFEDKSNILCIFT